MRIVTERLIVRNFRMSDINDLHEILGDTETMKYCELAYSYEQAQKFLQDFCIAQKGAFAVVHKDKQKVIGYILFKAWETSVYELGWIFNKSFWRQGYAYEACSSIIAYAFEKMNVSKVVAETIDTQKSIGLMKKLGMKLAEIQKDATKDTFGNPTDMYVYEISKESVTTRIV